jgi:hypothetical protein
MHFGFMKVVDDIYPARFLALAGGFCTPTNQTLSGGEKYEQSFCVTDFGRS